MNTYERAYAKYLRTLERRERGRLRSAEWNRTHLIKPFRYTPNPDLEGWIARIKRDIELECGVPQRGSVVEVPNTPCYLWVAQTHPSSQIPPHPPANSGLHPECRSSHKA